jgi:hypothetical protein
MLLTTLLELEPGRIDVEVDLGGDLGYVALSDGAMTHSV